MEVIPNPKMAFIFPISCILALIFPILLKYFPKCEGKGSFPKSQINSLPPVKHTNADAETLFIFYNTPSRGLRAGTSFTISCLIAFPSSCCSLVLFLKNQAVTSKIFSRTKWVGNAHKSKIQIKELLRNYNGLELFFR